MPRLQNDIYCLVEVKGRRVRFRLKELLRAEGQLDSYEEWEKISKRTNYIFSFTNVYHLREPEELTPGGTEAVPIATEEDLAEAHSVLDQLANLSDQIRVFIVDKFKIEDVL